MNLPRLSRLVAALATPVLFSLPANAQAPTASFTHSILACTVVQFTDTSTGGPTAWAWDVDDDGTIDYTTQSPVHNYPRPGRYRCKLIVTNLSGTDSVTQDVPIGVGKLTTLYAANNGGSVGGIVYFDLTVQNSVRITSFDTNYDVPVSSPVGLLVYTVANTYVGNQQSALAWTLVAQDDGTATSAGANNPTKILLQAPFVLQPGTYGMGLVAVGDGHRYTNGNGTNQSYSDANLALAAGQAQNVPFTGSPFNPRVWNGSIEYSLAPGAVDYGPGSDSGLNNGAPQMTTTALPYIGQTAELSIVQHDPGAAGFVVAGFGRGPIPTPVGTVNFNRILPFTAQVAAVMPIASGVAFKIPIPFVCTISGRKISWQNVNLVPAAPRLVSMSNGVEWTVAQ